MRSQAGDAPGSGTRRWQGLTATALALVAVTALAACGGKSDEQKVRDVVNGFDKTLFDNKFSQACGYLSDNLVTSMFHSPKGCISAIETHNPATEGGTIKSVAVHGDRATVVAQGVTEGPAAIELQKQGGTWKITGPSKYFRG
jgi:hypothetical protein